MKLMNIKYIKFLESILDISNKSYLESENNISRRFEDYNKRLDVLIDKKNKLNNEFDLYQKQQDSNSVELNKINKRFSRFSICVLFVSLISLFLFIALDPDNINNGIFAGILVGAFILINIIASLITDKITRKYKKEISDKNYKIEEAINKTNSEIDLVNKKLSNLKQRQEKLSRRKDSVNSQLSYAKKLKKISTQFDKDGNDILDIFETKHLKEIISKYQKEIRELEKNESKDYTRDLSKIISYLNNYSIQLNESYQTIGSSFDLIKIYNLPKTKVLEYSDILNNEQIAKGNETFQELKKGYVFNRGYSNRVFKDINVYSSKDFYYADNPFILLMDKLLHIKDAETINDCLYLSILAGIQHKRPIVIIAKEIDEDSIYIAKNNNDNSDLLDLCLIELGTNYESEIIYNKISKYLSINPVTDVNNFIIDGEKIPDNFLEYLGKTDSINVEANKTTISKDIEEDQLNNLLDQFSKIEAEYTPEEEKNITLVHFNEFSTTKFDKAYNHFILSVNRYEVLLSTLVLMVNRLIKDDLISYYSLRDKFEALGIFESHYDKKLLSTFDNLSGNVDDLKNEVLSSKEDIMFEIDLLTDRMNNISLFR